MPTSRHLFNYLALQAQWLVAVWGAGRGLWWPALVALAGFALVHVALGGSLRREAGLVGLAVLLGALVDSVMAASGLVHYAAPMPWSNLAPIWILALWAGLALTLRHSLAWLMRRPPLAVLVMGIGGPLSYLGAQSGFDAVRFSAPTFAGLVTLGALWAAATAVLAMAALHRPRAPRVHPVSPS